MALANNSLKIPLIVAVVFSAASAFTEFNLTWYGHALDTHIQWIFPVALALAYMLSQVNVGAMKWWEFGSFVATIGTFVGSIYITQLADFVANTQPISGLSLFGLALLSVAILSRDTTY